MAIVVAKMLLTDGGSYFPGSDTTFSPQRKRKFSPEKMIVLTSLTNNHLSSDLLNLLLIRFILETLKTV